SIVPSQHCRSVDPLATVCCADSRASSSQLWALRPENSPHVPGNRTAVLTSSPEQTRFQIDRIERRDTHYILIGRIAEQQPVFALAAIGFKRAQIRIDQPVVFNAGFGIDRHLLHANEAR